MSTASDTPAKPFIAPDWLRGLSRFEKPDLRKATWQLLDTLVPYLALWALMVWMVQRGVSYWLVLPLTVVAAGLVLRTFIFFHDCGHGSFFASRRANRILGYISGVLTFTPFDSWTRAHAMHHATTADLDRRGIGDVWTMTVAEYLAAPWRTRLVYRVYRNPVVMFVLAPPLMFVVAQRFPHPGAGKPQRDSVLYTNLALLAIVVVASQTIGLGTYLMIQLPIIWVAASVGVWLFYVQHQFEDDYWARHHNWDPIRAALEGSSYYKLPKVLQWFSGNIGLHHIHHLRPRIPNYHLQWCYDSTPELQAVKPLTIARSFKSLFLNLWDEPNQQLIAFGALRRQRR